MMTQVTYNLLLSIILCQLNLISWCPVMMLIILMNYMGCKQHLKLSSKTLVSMVKAFKCKIVITYLVMMIMFYWMIKLAIILVLLAILRIELKRVVQQLIQSWMPKKIWILKMGSNLNQFMRWDAKILQTLSKHSLIGIFPCKECTHRSISLKVWKIQLFSKES